MTEDEYSRLEVCPECGMIYGRVVVDGMYGHGSYGDVIPPEKASALILKGIEAKNMYCLDCSIKGILSTPPGKRVGEK